MRRSRLLAGTAVAATMLGIGFCLTFTHAYAANFADLEARITTRYQEEVRALIRQKAGDPTMSLEQFRLKERAAYLRMENDLFTLRAVRAKAGNSAEEVMDGIYMRDRMQLKKDLADGKIAQADYDAQLSQMENDYKTASRRLDKQYQEPAQESLKNLANADATAGTQRYVIGPNGELMDNPNYRGKKGDFDGAATSSGLYRARDASNRMGMGTTGTVQMTNEDLNFTLNEKRLSQQAAEDLQETVDEIKRLKKDLLPHAPNDAARQRIQERINEKVRLAKVQARRMKGFQQGEKYTAFTASRQDLVGKDLEVYNSQQMGDFQKSAPKNARAYTERVQLALEGMDHGNKSAHLINKPVTQLDDEDIQNLSKTLHKTLGKPPGSGINAETVTLSKRELQNILAKNGWEGTSQDFIDAVKGRKTGVFGIGVLTNDPDKLVRFQKITKAVVEETKVKRMTELRAARRDLEAQLNAETDPAKRRKLEQVLHDGDSFTRDGLKANRDMRTQGGVDVDPDGKPLRGMTNSDLDVPERGKAGPGSKRFGHFTASGLFMGLLDAGGSIYTRGEEADLRTQGSGIEGSGEFIGHLGLLVGKDITGYSTWEADVATLKGKEGALERDIGAFYSWMTGETLDEGNMAGLVEVMPSFIAFGKWMHDRSPAGLIHLLMEQSGDLSEALPDLGNRVDAQGNYIDLVNSDAKHALAAMITEGKLRMDGDPALRMLWHQHLLAREADIRNENRGDMTPEERQREFQSFLQDLNDENPDAEEKTNRLDFWTLVGSGKSTYDKTLARGDGESYGDWMARVFANLKDGEVTQAFKDATQGVQDYEDLTSTFDGAAGSHANKAEGAKDLARSLEAKVARIRSLSTKRATDGGRLAPAYYEKLLADLRSLKPILDNLTRIVAEHRAAEATGQRTVMGFKATFSLARAKTRGLHRDFGALEQRLVLAIYDAKQDVERRAETEQDQNDPGHTDLSDEDLDYLADQASKIANGADPDQEDYPPDGDETDGEEDLSGWEIAAEKGDPPCEGENADDPECQDQEAETEPEPDPDDYAAMEQELREKLQQRLTKGDALEGEQPNPDAILQARLDPERQRLEAERLARVKRLQQQIAQREQTQQPQHNPTPSAPPQTAAAPPTPAVPPGVTANQASFYAGYYFGHAHGKFVGADGVTYATVDNAELSITIHANGTVSGNISGVAKASGAQDAVQASVSGHFEDPNIITGQGSLGWSSLNANRNEAGKEMFTFSGSAIADDFITGKWSGGGFTGHFGIVKKN